MAGRDELLDDFHGNFLPNRSRPKRLAAIRGDNFNQGDTRGNFRHPANMQCGKSTFQPCSAATIKTDPLPRFYYQLFAKKQGSRLDWLFDGGSSVGPLQPAMGRAPRQTRASGLPSVVGGCLMKEAATRAASLR